MALTAMFLSGARDARGRASRGPIRAPRRCSALPAVAPLILASRASRILPLPRLPDGHRAFSLATYSIAVARTPGREGIAAGVVMGLAIGLGGAGALPGFVADRAGVAVVFPYRGSRPRGRDWRDAPRGARPDQTGNPERSVRYEARSSPTITKTSPVEEAGRGRVDFHVRRPDDKRREDERSDEPPQTRDQKEAVARGIEEIGHRGAGRPRMNATRPKKARQQRDLARRRGRREFRCRARAIERQFLETRYQCPRFMAQTTRRGQGAQHEAEESQTGRILDETKGPRPPA
jgi:hypothetical protein